MLYNNIGQRPNTMLWYLPEKIHHILDIAGIFLLLGPPWFLFTGLDFFYFLSLGGVVGLLYCVTDFKQDQNTPPEFLQRSVLFFLRTGLSFVLIWAVLFLVNYLNLI